MRFLRKIIEAFSLLLPNVDLKKFNNVNRIGVPNKQDINIIMNIALEEYNKINLKNILSILGTKIADTNKVSWLEKDGKIILNIENDDQRVMKYYLLKFFSNKNWSENLEKKVTFNFSEKINDNNSSVPVFETSAFKGLEAEGIVLVTKGQSFSHFNELYVACSRAKKVLAIVADKENERFNKG